MHYRKPGARPGNQNATKAPELKKSGAVVSFAVTPPAKVELERRAQATGLKLAEYLRQTHFPEGMPT